ncbi:MAG: O-antigen ligase family protein, partial [Candidatus Methanofastidiosa archaeon]|nr:O-antigen ligase family protein [Candidatus Methanofastidiosa archaeon]
NELIVKGSYIIATVTIILFVWSYFSKNLGSDPVGILINFQNKTNYGLITGWLYNMSFARVYFANGIYMLVGLTYTILNYLNYRKRKDGYWTIILLIGIFVSGTRGYWLGSLLIVFFIILILNREMIGRVIKMSILLLLSIILIINFMPNRQVVLDRIFSISDFKEDESNSIRSIQIEELSREIKKRPLIGYGFGSTLYNYEYRTGRDGKNVELYYLELIYKTGIVGGAILSILLLCSFVSLHRAIKSKRISQEDRVILQTWGISSVIVLIIGITNPYLKGAFGIFIVDMMIINYLVIKREKDIRVKI